mgnify:CR=1 FL=1
MTTGIVNYLISGAPELRYEDEIDHFTHIARTHPARYTTVACLRYLYGEIPENEEYASYKDMRLFREQYAGTGGYSHTLEQIYKEAHSSNVVAQIFLKSILQGRRYFAGVCRSVSEHDIIEIVRARVELYGLI